MYAPVGIQKQDIEKIVQNAYRPDRMNNNPRAITPETLHILLEKLL